MWNLDKMLGYSWIPFPFCLVKDSHPVKVTKFSLLNQSVRDELGQFPHSVLYLYTVWLVEVWVNSCKLKPFSKRHSNLHQCFAVRENVIILAALGIIFFSIKEKESGTRMTTSNPPELRPLRRLCTHSINDSWLILLLLSCFNCVKRGEQEFGSISIRLKAGHQCSPQPAGFISQQTLKSCV